MSVSRAMRLTALIASFAGCANDFTTSGDPLTPIPVRLVNSTPYVDATVDGAAGRPLVIDTGSPITWIDPAGYPGAMLAPGYQRVASVALGGFAFENVAGEIDTFGSGATTQPAGVVGGDVLRHFALTIDYRDAWFTLGAPASPPPNVAAIASVATMSILGGGTARYGREGSQVRSPPTRAVVNATIEGTDVSLLVDTGYSTMGVDAALFAALRSDGRASVSIATFGAMGLTTAFVTRTRTVTVAGESVTGAAVLAVDDATIQGITHEVGRSVRGVLGGAFLREFYVTMDYPQQQLRLKRFATRDHVHDELVRVAIMVVPSANGWAAQFVAPGSDAARVGIAVGTTLVSIDGQALGGLDMSAVDALLLGAVGTAHVVGWLDGNGASHTDTLHCVDLVPLN